jgi:hypothetical protein
MSSYPAARHWLRISGKWLLVEQVRIPLRLYRLVPPFVAPHRNLDKRSKAYRPNDWDEIVAEDLRALQSISREEGKYLCDSDSSFLIA